jgi:hypothetical protein
VRPGRGGVDILRALRLGLARDLAAAWVREIDEA